MDSNHRHQESNSCVLPIELNGYIEECEINPTLFFWSFHVVRFCERRVKFKLASPLYSDHPYNVTGGNYPIRTDGPFMVAGFQDQSIKPTLASFRKYSP